MCKNDNITITATGIRQLIKDSSIKTSFPIIDADRFIAPNFFGKKSQKQINITTNYLIVS